MAAQPVVQHLVPSYAAAAVVAFLLIAFGVMLAAAILGRVLRWILHSIGLGWADRLAGGAFGLVKGYILVALGIAAVAAFFPRQPWFDQSQLVPYFLPGAHGSTTVLPQDLGVRIQSGLHSLQQAARREASGMGQHELSRTKRPAWRFGPLTKERGLRETRVGQPGQPDARRWYHLR